VDAHTTVNQRLWDELAPLHAASAYYDVDSFLRGQETLTEVEVAEVGDVRAADELDGTFDVVFLSPGRPLVWLEDRCTSCIRSSPPAAAATSTRTSRPWS
jgi:hypothetical protein